MVHIFGGKWTTYRQMAEDTVNAVIKAGLLEKKPCQTVDLKLHGYTTADTYLDETPFTFYGADQNLFIKIFLIFMLKFNGQSSMKWLKL